jgi:preprotein translocase subunit SecE
MDKMKNYLDRAVSFIKEAWIELSKVHFPSPKETMQASAVVVVLAFLMALWLGLVDMAATRVVRQFLS